MRYLLLSALFCTGFLARLQAQEPDLPAMPAQAFGPGIVAAKVNSTDSVLVTIVLKHQQDKNLS